MDLFIPWDALYLGAEKQSGQKDIPIDQDSFIRMQWHSTADKCTQTIEYSTIYTKIHNETVIATEHEVLPCVWYYRYEMELLLEKCGFTVTEYLEHTWNNEPGMLVVAERV